MGECTVAPFVQQPGSELEHTAGHVHARGPPGGRAELADVGDVVALVRGAPLIELHAWLAAVDPPDELDQLEQADGVARSPSNIEGLALQGRHAVLRP